MVTMSVLPERHAMTRADLDALPDDGRRYELIDGSLVVTPSPSRRHQGTVFTLVQLLHAACPKQLLVGSAPTDVTLDDHTSLQPDVFVVAGANFDDEAQDLRPLLVIEVLSPSTRQIDLTLKKSRYETAGCPAYWVVDPVAPSITAWALTDGEYGEPTVVAGADLLRVSAPFEVTISPSQLTR